MASPTPKTRRDLRFVFNAKHKIMNMFSDNAKTYIQLSAGALVLTLTFANEIFHAASNVADIWMILMWSCFLLAVVAGAFYQYLAPKYLERYLPWHTAEFWDWLSPGLVYGIMLTAFFVGTFIFTVSAIIAVTHVPRSK